MRQRQVYTRDEVRTKLEFQEQARRAAAFHVRGDAQRPEPRVAPPRRPRFERSVESFLASKRKGANR